MPKDSHRTSKTLTTPYKRLNAGHNDETDKFDPNIRRNVYLGRYRYVYRDMSEEEHKLNIRVMTGKLKCTKTGTVLSHVEWGKLKGLLEICSFFLVSLSIYLSVHHNLFQATEPEAARQVGTFYKKNLSDRLKFSLNHHRYSRPPKTV